MIRDNRTIYVDVARRSEVLATIQASNAQLVADYGPARSSSSLRGTPMTIVNAAVWRDHALIGADAVVCGHDCQLIRDGSGAPVLDRKLVHLPVAHCVMSLLGSLHLRSHLRDELQDASSFDEIVERAPELLRGAPHYISANVQSRYGRGNQAVVVGWSVRHEAMCTADFSDRRGYEAVTHVPPAGGACYWFGPAIRLPPFSDYPEDAAGMLRVAELQVARFRGEHSDAPLGGPFTVASLTRGELAFEVVGDLGLPGSPHHPMESITCT